MITAELQGRRLVLTVQGDDGPAFAPYSIEPLSAKTGRELSRHYLAAIEGLQFEPYDLPADMVLAFGKENYERADAECSTAEGEMLAQAAFFWQSVGGIDSVRALLALGEDGNQGGVDSLSKAIAAFRLRMVPYLSQIRRDLESARRTLEASTPATGTPSGSGTSEPEPPNGSPSATGAPPEVSTATTGSD